MRAVILAGGQGTRLRPFTTTIPKPIVPVGEMAVMEIVIRQLARDGFDHLTVAVSHQAQLIMAYFGDGAKWGLTIDYSIEDEPLGTIGPLKLIDDLPENFLVTNGDILTDMDFAAMFRQHADSGAIATVATFRRELNIDFGVLTSDEADGRITSFTEKPVEQFHVSMGVYAFSKRILELVPDGRAYGFDHLMGDLIAGEHDVRAYPWEGYWLDIGRPDDYDRANTEFEQMRSVLLPPDEGA